MIGSSFTKPQEIELVLFKLLHVDVGIEGIPVTALVDTGAQSTIISRSTLHAVNQHLKQKGRELPQLELPTVRLYGKDGEKGNSVGLTIRCELSPLMIQSSICQLTICQILRSDR